jgi:hypothetical protein
LPLACLSEVVLVALDGSDLELALDRVVRAVPDCSFLFVDPEEVDFDLSPVESVDLFDRRLRLSDGMSEHCRLEARLSFERTDGTDGTDAAASYANRALLAAVSKKWRRP